MSATTTWMAGVSTERRSTPDRRITHSILCQEALAHIIAETRGEDSYAGRALKELERRRAENGLASGDDEIIIYSLRGQWLVERPRDPPGHARADVSRVPQAHVEAGIVDGAASTARRPHRTRRSCGDWLARAQGITCPPLTSMICPVT